MATKSFEVKIVTRHAETLAGLKVATTMERAKEDCPRLWEEFGPRMHEFSGLEAPCSYGVSIMTNEEACAFDYWAAMPVVKGKPAPKGMSVVQLPAGMYAECAVESLEQLLSAYAYVYTTWLPAQNTYQIEVEKPCYELYPGNFMESGKLNVYFPIKNL